MFLIQKLLQQSSRHLWKGVQLKTKPSHILAHQLWSFLSFFDPPPYIMRRLRPLPDTPLYPTFTDSQITTIHNYNARLRPLRGRRIDGHCDGHWTGTGRALYGHWTEVPTAPSGDECGQSSRTAPGQPRSPYLSQLWLKFRLRLLSVLCLRLGVGLGWVSVCVLFRSGKTMTW